MRYYGEETDNNIEDIAAYYDNEKDVKSNTEIDKYF